MNTRPILPVTAEWYNTSTEAIEYAPYTDYYVTDVITLAGWESLRSIPTTQTWCPLNSFNIPLGREVIKNVDNNRLVIDRPRNAEADIICLQGAGDILMAMALVNQIKQYCDTSHINFYMYDHYLNLVNKQNGMYRAAVKYDGVPTNLTNEVLEKSYVFNDCEIHCNLHRPPACYALLCEAISRKWDHYDWKGLISGMKILPEFRRIYLELTEDDKKKAAYIANNSFRFQKTIGIHAFASNDTRSYPELIKLAETYGKRYDNVEFVLFGGNAESKIPESSHFHNLAGKLTYRETAALLPYLSGLIAVDSVVMHMAAMTDIPVLGIYRWSPSTWAGPRNDRFESIMIKDTTVGTISAMGRISEWLEVRLNNES